jgi:ATP-binding cassette subfamily B protein
LIRDLRKLWPWLRQNRALVIIAVSLVPFVSLTQAALPLILKATIDHGIIPGDLRYLASMGGVYLAAVFLEYAGRTGQTVTAASAVHRMVRAMRESVIAHVLGLSASYHDRSLSGSLVTRATSEFDNLSESLNQGVLTSVVDLAVLAGCMIGMLVLDWRLALTAFTMIPVLVVIVRWFSRGLRDAMLSARKHIATLNAYTQECLYGASTIKLLTASNHASRRFGELNETYRNAQMRSVVLDAVMFAVLDGFSAMTTGMVLWLAIRHLAPGAASGDSLLASGVSAGVLVAFVQYVQQMFEPLKQLGNKMAMLQGAFTSIDRIFGLLETKDAIGGTEEAHITRGHVRFDQVGFTYESRNDRPVLRGVSFDLPAGQSLALVGPTGSGKSTIIKLLAKLYDRYSGSITIDGKEIAQLSPASLRRQVAVVPQDIVLFDGTLRFNISLGREGIADEDMTRALDAVCAGDFIRSLPGGLDFQIREQGANLSHGQRQLVVFARALAVNPALLILDEATSSVDQESESRIQQAIDAMLNNRTVIVIAHRLSTVARCNQILVVRDGEIAERGTHAELMARQGIYRNLHDQPGHFQA